MKSIPFAKVFTDIKSNISTKYNVIEFPHLIIFDKKVPRLYKGGREADGKS